MKVTVVGLGKIGLPLAVQVAGSGHHVAGADLSEHVVSEVNAGRSPFGGEPGLDARLAELRADGSLRATTDTAGAVRESDVVLVVVPLVVDAAKQPDFAALDAVTACIGPLLRPGVLVSYETTLPLGTTRGRFLPALAAASGLTPGADLFVCHSPERVSSGTVFRDLARYPKLVGGVDAPSGARAVSFYTSALQFEQRPDLPVPNGVWDLGSAEAAEMTKLAETTYRDVNIALANEFALCADRWGLDVMEVIAAANSQPYSHVHRPGVAVGGHCIPVYPHFYLAGDPGATLPAAARVVNTSMPGYAVRLLHEMLGGVAGRTVVVLGASYRGGVKETAFSGVWQLVAALDDAGAKVRVHDPLFSDAELSRMGLTSHHLGDPCDAALLQADHREYGKLSPADLPGVRAVLDGRGVLDPTRWPGVRVRTLGRPEGAGPLPRGSAAGSPGASAP